jgi:hypothetical protein
MIDLINPTARNTDLKFLHPVFRTALTELISDLQRQEIPLYVFEATRTPVRQAYLFQFFFCLCSYVSRRVLIDKVRDHGYYRQRQKQRQECHQSTENHHTYKWNDQEGILLRYRIRATTTLTLTLQDRRHFCCCIIYLVQNRSANNFLTCNRSLMIFFKI